MTTSRARAHALYADLPSVKVAAAERHRRRMPVEMKGAAAGVVGFAVVQTLVGLASNCLCFWRGQAQRSVGEGAQAYPG